MLAEEARGESLAKVLHKVQSDGEALRKTIASVLEKKKALEEERAEHVVAFGAAEAARLAVEKESKDTASATAEVDREVNATHSAMSETCVCCASPRRVSTFFAGVPHRGADSRRARKD